MSTDSATPAAPSAGGPATGLATGPADPMSAPTGPGTTTGVIGSDPAPTDATAEGSTLPEQKQPGWIERHTTLLTTVLVAVIVAALAIAGLFYYRHGVDSRNADTEAAFTSRVTEQGATVETVQCHGNTCAAVIGGQAYTVLVQKDAQGQQHFGVSAYAGD